METMVSLIHMAIFAILGLCSLIGALCFGAYWHLASAILCFVMAVTLYHETGAEGQETVKAFLTRIIKRRK